MENFVAAVTSKNTKVSNQHITDDLFFSILSKLPIKSLKRFGCVRKSWDLLFENFLFMTMYRNNFISNICSDYDDSSVILQHYPPYFEVVGAESALYFLSNERFENRVKLDWPPPFQEDPSLIQMLGSGSINGILFLKRETQIVLWNLATKEFKVIPPSSVESPPYHDPMIELHGFGYDRDRNDYKLIRHITFFHESDAFFNPFCEIYSLRNNSWRELNVNMPKGYHEMIGFQVYMDGMCHWIGESVVEECLVSFDLNTELFFTTDMPSDKDEIRSYISSTCDSFNLNLARDLVVLNGSIALISYYVTTTTFHISILGELGVKESWTKLFIVGPLSCVCYPIGVGKNGDIFVRKKGGELAWFNLSTQIFDGLGIKGHDSCCQVGIYKESLLPIG